MISTDELLAKDVLPDPVLRMGIRHRLAGTLAPFEKLDCEGRQTLLMRHVEELRASPIAIATDEANEQHYELPTRFFQRVLGRHMKYSSGYWDAGVTDILTVLDSQRTLLGIEESVISVQADRTIAYIQLYKALGGGWSK